MNLPSSTTKSFYGQKSNGVTGLDLSLVSEILCSTVEIR